MRFQPRLTLTLLACAMLMRLMSPAGWMPSVAGGPFTIEPCPAAAAPMPMRHGASQGQHVPAHGGVDAGDCAYAPMHAAVVAPDFEAKLQVPADERILFTSGAVPIVHATGPPAPPPPATGPPTLA